MSIQLTLSPGDDHPLPFYPGLPPNYSGPILQGAVCHSVQHLTDDLTIQELKGQGLSMRYVQGYFHDRLYAKGWIHSEGLYCYCMLKNSSRKRVVGLSHTHIREEQYECFYVKPSDCSSLFEKNHEFRMVDLFYSTRLLKQLIPFFPALKSIIGTDTGYKITQKPFWLPLSVKEIINQLLHCPCNATAGSFYFDLKMKELLYHILLRSFTQDSKLLSFTPWEVSRIHNAKKILQEHIGTKPPSVRKLARLVALNEYKLKKGFRQFFHCGIAQWLQEQKLQHSRDLILNTNHPIKEICTLVGYPFTANFITAFKKKFGITPGLLRRKQSRSQNFLYPSQNKLS